MARRRRLTPAQPFEPAAPGQSSADSAPPNAQVAGQTAEAAALREITQGLQAAREEGRMVVEVPLDEIAPDYLARDRIDLDDAEMAALKASIDRHGQRVPAELTPLAPVGDGPPRDLPPDPDTPRFGLISGWRRLRALTELFAETGDTRFSTLRALVRPPSDAADAYVAMVEENEVRVGLSYYERAGVVVEATRRGIFPDQATALRTLFATASRAKRSKIASFTDIHAQLGDLLRFPTEIPERLGLALVAALRRDGAEPARQILSAARPESATAELRVLERCARPLPGAVSRAKQTGEEISPGLALQAERKGRRITLTLSGSAVDDALLERVQAALRSLV